MTDLVPPWAQPAGEGHRRRRAEDRTAVWRCMGKPSETVGRKAIGTKVLQTFVSTAMSAWLLILANHWKRWDAKLWELPRASARLARLQN